MGRLRGGEDKDFEKLASLLPDEMRLEDNSSRLLCLVELMRTLTDEEHPLSYREIREVMKARFGADKAPSENTIAANLRSINESRCLGVRIHVDARGAWCENTRISPANVRLLLNAVQTSRFLTTQQGKRLEKPLFDMVSYHQRALFESKRFYEHVQVEHRARREDQRVLETCDTILRAIRDRRKVEFCYTYLSFDKSKHVLTGDDGSRVRVETPIALIFSSDNYYLESYAEVPWRHASVTRSRVDRMTKVSVSDEPADDVSAWRRTLPKRIKEAFDSMGGETRCVVMRVRSDALNEVFDRFGYDIKFLNFHGTVGDPASTMDCAAYVAQSNAFFRWLSGTRGGVKLVRPAAIDNWPRRGPWAKGDKVTQARMEQDFNELRRGYHAYLETAARAIEE